MNTQLLLFIGFASTVLLSLAIGAWGRRRSGNSLVSFFWGDNNFSVAQGAHLNISTSFAINGVLYSAWLGYKAGWASVLPQVIWCFGFLFLARYAKRLAHLARTGTLHGNIGYVFGKSAARWAAVASIIGFTLLFGWELFIGASMFKAVEGTQSDTVETLLYFSLAGIAAIYCMLGGLRGNLHANRFQNYLGGVSLIVAIVYLGWFAAGTQHFSWADLADVSTLDALATELTIAGIVTNAILFLIYQFLDMSVWQNIAAVSSDSQKPRKALWASAFWIFVFPGVTGSALGMVMRSFDTGVDANNIVPLILEQLTAQPVILVLLVMGFFAMMLSTVDGLLLAACQAVTWDITDRKKVLKILTARGSAVFTAEDIKLPGDLARQLLDPQDALSKYIGGRLTTEAQRDISQAASRGDDELASAVSTALNSLLVMQDLYDPKQFAGVSIGEDASTLLKREAKVATDIALANRWILEAAYPEALNYNQFSNTMRHEKAYLDENWSLGKSDLQEVEGRALDHARYAIALVALIGGGVTLFLVRDLGVNSFNLLYITYVAQMALFPAIWVIIRGETRPQRRGAASISLGLLAGFAAVVYGLATASPVAMWAPTIAVVVASVIYWPFRPVGAAAEISKAR